MIEEKSEDDDQDYVIIEESNTYDSCSGSWGYRMTKGFFRTTEGGGCYVRIATEVHEPPLNRKLLRTFLSSRPGSFTILVPSLNIVDRTEIVILKSTGPTLTLVIIRGRYVHCLKIATPSVILGHRNDRAIRQDIPVSTLS